MREQESVGAVVRGIALLLVVCAWSSSVPHARAQAAPADAVAAAALAADVNALVAQFAEQRDALGGWPAAVQTVYDRLSQIAQQLTAAANSGDLNVVQRRHRAFQRVAARISRWLVNRYEPRNEGAPTREARAAVAARLAARVNTVAALATEAGVVLDLTAVNTARQQLESVLANGTDAQVRAALRALRDQIDALQDAFPDETN
ncbi:MAG TPA: hypothetical protein VJR89_40415 [Polyangiales bacterium]|nr:hypothetical protein [Polyangiales bacterium]